jgi:hypothetical protein
VAGDDGVDSILQFRLEKGGDKINHYWKMKRRKQARLGSIGRNRDRRNDVMTLTGGDAIPGGEMEETTQV